MSIQCNWCQKFYSLKEIESGLTEADKQQFICVNCLAEQFLPREIAQKNGESDIGGEEARTSERYPITTQIYLSTKSKENEVLKGVILDLSDHGIKLRLEQQFDNGEEVVIGFFSDKESFKYKGKAVYNRSSDVSGQFETGIEFQSVQIQSHS